MSERIIKFKNDSIGSMSLKSVEIIPNEIPIKPVYNVDLPELDTWSRYVNYYGDLSEVFSSDTTGRTKSQWGEEHYKNHGQTEGHYLPGMTDLRGYIGYDAIEASPDTGGYYDLKITKSLWDPMWYPIKGSDGKAMMLYHVGEKANFIWHRTFTDWIDDGSTSHSGNQGFRTNGPGVREWTKHAIDFLTRRTSTSRKILVYENAGFNHKYSFKKQQVHEKIGAFEEILEGDEISYVSVDGFSTGITAAEEALIDAEVLSDYDVIVFVSNSNGSGPDCMTVKTLAELSEFCKIEGKGVLFLSDHGTYNNFPNYICERLFNDGVLEKLIEFDGTAVTSSASNSPRFDDPQWQVFGDIFKDATGDRYGNQGRESLNGDILGWEFDKKFIFEGNSPDNVYIEGHKGKRYDKDNPTLPSGKLINGEAINTFAPVEARYIRLSVLKGTPQWYANGGGCLQMELYDTAGEALTRNLPTSNWTESSYWDYSSWKPVGYKASYSLTGRDDMWAFGGGDCATYPSNTSSCKRCPSTWEELDALDYCFTPGEEWVQVDLGEIKDVHRIGTKGRNSIQWGFQYVTSYCIQYSVNGTDWSYICNRDRSKDSIRWQAPPKASTPHTSSIAMGDKTINITASDNMGRDTFYQHARILDCMDIPYGGSIPESNHDFVHDPAWINSDAGPWRWDFSPPIVDPLLIVNSLGNAAAGATLTCDGEIELVCAADSNFKVNSQTPSIFFANWKDGYPDDCQNGKFVSTSGGPDHQWIDRRYWHPADGYWLQRGGSNSLDITFIPAEDFETPLEDGRYMHSNKRTSKECIYEEARLDSIAKGGTLANIFWSKQHRVIKDSGEDRRGWLGLTRIQLNHQRGDNDAACLARDYFYWTGSEVEEEWADKPGYAGIGLYNSGSYIYKLRPDSSHQQGDRTESIPDYLGGSTIWGKEGVGCVRFIGEYSSITINADVYEHYHNFIWGANVPCDDGASSRGMFPLTLAGLPEHSKVRIEISEDISLFSIDKTLFDVDQPIVFNNKGTIYSNNIIDTQHDIYYESTGEFSGFLPVGVSSAESLRSYNFLQGKSFDIQTIRPDRSPETLPVTIAAGREVDVLITPLNTTDDILHEENAPNIVFKYDCPIGTDNEIVATRKLQSEIRNYVDYSKDNLYLTIIDRHQTAEDRQYITLKKTLNTLDGSYVYRQQPGGGSYWEMSYTDDPGWMLKRLNGANPCSYKYNPKDNEYSDVEYITLPIDLSYCLTGMGNTSDMTWSPVDVDPTDDSLGFVISHSLPQQPSIPSSAKNKTGMYGLDILHRFDVDQSGGLLQLEWTEADNMKDLVYIIQYIPYTSAVENSKKYGYIVDPRSGSLAKTITLDVSSIDSFDESHIIDNQISITPVDLHTGELDRYRNLAISGTLPGLNIVYDKDTETLDCGVMQSDITGNTAIKAHIESSEAGLSRDFNMVFEQGNTAMHDRMSKQTSSRLANARAIGYLDQTPLSHIYGTYTGLTAADNGKISGPKDWSYCSEWTDIIEGPSGESYIVINTMNDHEDQPRASVDLRVVFQQSTYKGWVLSNGTGDASKTTLSLGAGLGVNQNGYTYDIPGTDYHFDPSNPDIEDNAGSGATKVNTHTYNTLNSSGKSNYIAIAIENPEGKASLVQVDIVDEKTKDYAPLTYDHYRGRSMTGILEEVWETKYRKILPGGIECMISVDGDRMESPGNYEGGVWKSTFNLAYISNPTGKKQTRISIESLPKLKERDDEFTVSYSIGSVTRKKQFSVDQLWLANNSTYCSNFAPGRPDPYALNESTATSAAMTNAGTALRTSKDHGNKWYDSDPFEKHGYWLQSGGLHGEGITYVDGEFTWEEARLDAKKTGGELTRILHTNQLDIVNSLGPKDGWLGALENEFAGGHHLGFGDRHWHGWSRKSAPGGGDRTGSYLYYWVSPSTSVKRRNHIHVPSDGSSNNYVIPIPAGAGQGIVRESVPVNYLEEMRAAGISAYAVGDLGLTTGYIRYADGKYSLFVREPEGYPSHTNIVMGGWLNADNFQELETPERALAKYFLTFPDQDSDDQHSDSNIGSVRRFTSDQGTFLRTYSVDVPSTGSIEWIALKKFYRTID